MAVNSLKEMKCEQNLLKNTDGSAHLEQGCM